MQPAPVLECSFVYVFEDIHKAASLALRIQPQAQTAVCSKLMCKHLPVGLKHACAHQPHPHAWQDRQHV